MTGGPHAAGPRPGPARRARPRWGRRIARALTAAAVLWGTSVTLVLAWGMRDDAPLPSPPRADAIVVLGAAQYGGRPSPVLRARLDHAVSLWRAGAAPRLVLTGGVGMGDDRSEASVSRRYVVRLGVPDSALLLEHVGRTTEQSVAMAASLLAPRGWRSVILVSDPPHMLRTAILARRAGLSARTSPTRTGPAGWGRLAGYVLSESVKAPLAAVGPRPAGPPVADAPVAGPPDGPPDGPRRAP